MRFNTEFILVFFIEECLVGQLQNSELFVCSDKIFDGMGIITPIKFSNEVLSCFEKD